MLFLLAFVLGLGFGWTRARRRGGDRFDQLQYAAVHGILFALVSFALVVVFQRVLIG